MTSLFHVVRGVDVGDVARAHVEAAVRPYAEGRYILVAETLKGHAEQLIEARAPPVADLPRSSVPAQEIRASRGRREDGVASGANVVHPLVCSVAPAVFG